MALSSPSGRLRPGALFAVAALIMLVSGSLYLSWLHDAQTAVLADLEAANVRAKTAERRAKDADEQVQEKERQVIKMQHRLQDAHKACGVAEGGAERTVDVRTGSVPSADNSLGVSLREVTALHSEQRQWAQFAEKALAEEQNRCEKQKNFACPRSQADFLRKLDELEEFYGELAANVRALLVTDRPLSAEEQAFENALAQYQGFTKDTDQALQSTPVGLIYGSLAKKIGPGRLCVPYPRLNRLIARAFSQFPDLFTGTAGTHVGERSLRLASERDKESRMVKNLLSISTRLHKGEKAIYVAALIHNNEEILDAWCEEVTRFALLVGPSNVYIAVYESASKDKSREKLREFEKTLTSYAIPHHIMLDNASPEVVMGNMFRPVGDKTDRIYQLSKLRNIAMSDIHKLAKKGINFDKVLFINDVTIKVSHMLELLNTKNGEFDAVCGIDRRVDAYDLWVMRDQNGQVFSPVYPFVRDAKSAAMARRLEVYPVYSCWNGAIAMNAEPFVKREVAFRRSREGYELPHIAVTAHRTLHHEAS